MQDRELLELAAKAYNATNPSWHDDPTGGYRKGFMSTWNPLTNDGEALRLAAQLKLSIAFEARNDHDWSHIVWCEPCFEPIRDDPAAATRRAIVRAAAEIGKQSNAG